ncbi:hypothetical protein AOL_s00081g326 [Orbilia oligospora ATCC 24927]|uniref:HNH nuclease domain-containing protein n=1 Tax=Arthrobotrys oligospora (strain ATCC 24927 / CBS 115.81 / DSM 1491) TaxID=756982 RepID=G1XG33_ARTOA|nr:hypothetical protein AOL_s00081g326 [Orbilia oligospora ATCC 24927]EGX47999.1 hypothetical protein AOL_s00081g326 [Orbilia oligospora ATCC 24927]
MSSLRLTIRSVMWNIYIHTFKQTVIKPTRADAIAGFTCSNGLSISTRTIFEDLKIIYPSLHDYPNLTLWEVRDDGSVEFINSADEDREFEFKTLANNLRLCLGLIFHDTNHVLCQDLISRGAGITEHFHGIFTDTVDYSMEDHADKRSICLIAGCAKVPVLKFDPEKNGYLPNEPTYHISPTRRSHTPSEDSASRPATPGSDELRQREEQESREFARNNFDIDPKSFEGSVKYAYTECLITRTNSRCGPLLCGPGYAATHMVPPTLWFAYPDERPVEDFLSYDDELVLNCPEERDIYPFNATPSPNTDEPGLRSRMISTWSVCNGLLLRSDVHEMFNRRIIAIHPVTYRIRLFGAMPVVLEYHGQVVQWRDGMMADRVALAHHYTQCVIENVGANSIERYRLQSSQVLGVWKRQVDTILQSAWGGDDASKDNYIQEESLIKEHSW